MVPAGSKTVETPVAAGELRDNEVHGGELILWIPGPRAFEAAPLELAFCSRAVAFPTMCKRRTALKISETTPRVADFWDSY